MTAADGSDSSAAFFIAAMLSVAFEMESNLKSQYYEKNLHIPKHDTIVCGDFGADGER